MTRKSTNDHQPDDTATKIIHTFSTHEQADLAAANLRAHGIESWITSDDGGGMMPYLTSPGGVRLSVRESAAASALALIKS